jgi:hypothetical protein
MGGTNSAQQMTVAPQACATCGTALSPTPEVALNRGIGPLPWVYALGKIKLVSPTISWEKEFAQATGRADTKGLTDSQALYDVLSKPENSYLVREACWVMTIVGLETYILKPRFQSDFSLLVAALRPQRKPSDFDVIVGAKGPIAPPQMCNGLMLPIVLFDQIYYSDRETLIKAMRKPDSVDAKAFESAAEEVFDRIMLMTDNAGATNDNRALNYLAVRYDYIYQAVAEAFARDESLTCVDVRTSPLSGAREIVDVIFSFTNRRTDVTNKSFVRVDVTDEYPFMVSKWSPHV